MSWIVQQFTLSISNYNVGFFLTPVGTRKMHRLHRRLLYATLSFPSLYLRWRTLSIPTQPTTDVFIRHGSHLCTKVYQTIVSFRPLLWVFYRCLGCLVVLIISNGISNRLINMKVSVFVQLCCLISIGYAQQTQGNYSTMIYCYFPDTPRK